MPQDLPALAVKVADRHFGIGSDGLICICPSQTGDFRMQMFNADGSEGEMCGNGIRCVGKFVYDKGLTSKTDLTIETRAGLKKLKLQVEDGKVFQVTVDMGVPVPGETVIVVGLHAEQLQTDAVREKAAQPLGINRARGRGFRHQDDLLFHAPSTSPGFKVHRIMLK